MRFLVPFGSLLVLAAIHPCHAETINFDRNTSGEAPSGWTIAMTHQGGPPKWQVLRESSAPSKPNVLAQVSGDRTAGRFPLAIWDGISVKDGTISVKFKAVSGTVDQGAGLVWRYRDPNNYYIVRANALENNVVLYKVQNGERVSLAPRGAVSNAYGVKHQVPKQTWSTLSVSFQGNLFTVSLDSEKLFDVEDSTFTGAGKTGLWTKSDSVIYFDDFQVVDERKK
ncbi:MAG: hypothetical protein LAP61_23410 [Acidobacteriia bacterium]|nr:hypothetical protein [Terriglobia bacterium]